MADDAQEEDAYAKFNKMQAEAQKGIMSKGDNNTPSFAESLKNAPSPRGLSSPEAQFGKNYFVKGGIVRPYSGGRMGGKVLNSTSHKKPGC